MTAVTMPAWEAAVLAALAVLGASTIAGLAMAAIIRKHPAPASPPAPGTNPGAGDAAPQPQVPPKSPAPGLDPRSAIPLHDTGGVDFGITRWKCGCLMSFDALGRVVGTTICTQPQDIDEELRRMAP